LFDVDVLGPVSREPRWHLQGAYRLCQWYETRRELDAWHSKISHDVRFHIKYIRWKHV